MVPPPYAFVRYTYTHTLAEVIDHTYDSIMRIDFDIFLFKVSIVDNHFNIEESLLALTDGRGQFNVQNKSIVVNC